MYLLIGAAGRVGNDREWPMDGGRFARVVRELAPTNPFAASFFTVEGNTGLCCPDFDDVLHKAMYAELITYMPPDYNNFVLNLSSGQFLFDRISASEKEIQEAEAIWRRILETRIP